MYIRPSVHPAAEVLRVDGKIRLRLKVSSKRHKRNKLKWKKQCATFIQLINFFIISFHFILVQFCFVRSLKIVRPSLQSTLESSDEHGRVMDISSTMPIHLSIYLVLGGTARLSWLWRKTKALYLCSFSY